MTRLTGLAIVWRREGEPSLPVQGRSQGLGGGGPRRRIRYVAVVAGQLPLRLVRILMALCARRALDRAERELVTLEVALVALDRRVSSRQREELVMVELTCGLECLLAMALRAVVECSPAVHILVTGDATLLEPQERLPPA